MTKIIGESFKPWVRNQIKTRQEKLANKNKTDDVLRYTNNRGTFIRLTSGVNVNDSNVLALGGTLFGGDISPYNPSSAPIGLKNTDPVTGEIIKLTPENTPNLIPSQFERYSSIGQIINTYWSSPEFGYNPPPGIVSAEVRPLEMGQIREANIQIVCHNLKQFEIIEQLYLRLKYSILLEWGHTNYFDNSGKFEKNAPVRQTLSNLFLKSSNNHLDFLKLIEKKREESDGNYDAFLGFVTNFDWTLRTDGGYDISLRAYSLGDVIESLKINTNFPVPKQNWSSNRDSTNDSISLNRDRSTLHYILYSLKKEIDLKAGGSKVFALNGYNAGGQSSVHTGEIKRLTGLLVQGKLHPQEKWDTSNNILTEQEVTVGYYPNLSNSINDKQYFIKLGSLLRIINNFLLLYNVTAKDRPPIIKIDYDYDKNLCFTLPRQSSVDPRVCVLDLPEFADKTVTSNQFDEAYEVTYQYTEFINTSTAAASFPGGGNIGGLYEWSNDLDQLIDRYNTVRLTRAQLDQSGYKIGSNEYNLDDQTFIKQLEQASKIESSSLPGVSALPKERVEAQKLGDSSNFIIPGVIVHIAAQGYHNESYPRAEYYLSVDNVVVTDVSPSSENFDNSQSQYAAHFCESTPPFNNINFYHKFRVNNNEYIGKHMHILVNFQCIIDILNSLSDSDENSNVSLYDFLDTLMQKIQSALGNINNFKIIYNEVDNVFNIMDMTMLPGSKNYLAIENVTSRFHLNTLTKDKGSFVNNFTLKTEITNDLATNIAVGAQGQGNQVGFNATAFSKWNLNLTDRILKEKVNTNTPNASSLSVKTDKPFEKYRNNLSQYYYLMYKISKGTVTDSEIETYKGILADALNYEVGYHTDNNDIPGTGFIPLNLQLEMDGLSGMRIYETYNVEESLLPKSYNDNLEFITTTISHKIDNKGWTTTINGIGSPKYSAKPSYNPPELVLLDGCPTPPPPPMLFAPGGYNTKPVQYVGGDGYLTGTESQFYKRVPRSITLHYTDSPPTGRAASTVAHFMREKPRPFKAWGIHYAIDGYGSVVAGVPEDRYCVHGSYHNEYGIGIEFINRGRIDGVYANGVGYWKHDGTTYTYSEKDGSLLPGQKIINLGYEYEGSSWFIDFTDAQIAAAEKLFLGIIGRWPGIQNGIRGKKVWTIFGLKEKPKPGSSVRGVDYRGPNPDYGIFSHNTGGIRDKSKYREDGSAPNHLDSFPSPKLIQMLLRLGYVE